MAIDYTVLGQPGRDNALIVAVNSGQSRSTLLFDCGDDCLRNCAIRDIQAIDFVFFSHFHIDHVAGFDIFLRHNYARSDGPVKIFGPHDCREVIGHRVRGVTWNLVADSPGEYQVSSIDPSRVVTDTFRTSERFAVAHRTGDTPFVRTIVTEETYLVEAMIFDHGTPSIGYLVRERPRTNVNLDAIKLLGLAPGPWLKALKDPSVPNEKEVSVDGRQYQLGPLRNQLLVESAGASIAYLTDFSLDPVAEERLVEWLYSCDTVVCENNFRNADRELAVASRHLIADDVGRIANKANIGKLVVIHISDRYTHDEWLEQLAEIRQTFPAAEFPQEWL